MRNLKRALSLTLASVMLLGMMVFGTSAASFTDADQISNVTAATVLQELEVMQGSNGKFNPNSTVTRGQMAILICKMLYGNKLNAENFAGTSEFTDVPANAYYTGYVNLASQLGIISGYGNGKFGPGAPVTTAQAALMLTRALGWFQAGELENQNWTSNAIAAVEKATDVKLFGSLKLSNNDPLSRDNVCEMVFNAMTKTAPVKYNERWDAYYSKEGGVLQGVKFDYADTLGYKNFNLVYSEGGQDEFGRPATEWGTTNQQITTDPNTGEILTGGTITTSFIKSADDAVLTYTKAVKAKDIFADLGKPSNLKDSGVAAVVNNANNANATSATLTLDNTTETKVGAKGTVTEVFKASDNKITIVVTDTYLVRATSNYNTKDEELSVVVPGNTVQLSSNKISNDDVAVSQFAKDDLILVTGVFENGKLVVKTAELAEKVENVKISAYNANDYVTADKKREYSEHDGYYKDVTEDSYTLQKTAYTLVLDKAGYVIGIEKYSDEITLDDILFVKDAAKSGFTVSAKVVFMDGKEATVTVASTAAPTGDFENTSSTTTVTNNASAPNFATITAGDLADKYFYEYSVKSDGSYELRQVGSDRQGKVGALGANVKNVDGNKVQPVVARYSDPNYTYVTKTATSNTIFIAKDQIFIGTKNAPDVENSDTYYLYGTGSDSNYLLAVYSTESGISVASTSDYIYLLESKGGGKDDNDKSFNSYIAIKDGIKETDYRASGTAITVNGDSNKAAQGLYEIKNEKDGYPELKSANKVSNNVTTGDVMRSATGVSSDDISYRSDTVTAGTLGLKTNTDTKVYVVDVADKSASEIDPSGVDGVATGAYDVYAIFNSRNDDTVKVLWLAKTDSTRTINGGTGEKITEELAKGPVKVTGTITTDVTVGSGETLTFGTNGAMDSGKKVVLNGGKVIIDGATALPEFGGTGGKVEVKTNVTGDTMTEAGITKAGGVVKKDVAVPGTAGEANKTSVTLTPAKVEFSGTGKLGDFAAAPNIATGNSAGLYFIQLAGSNSSSHIKGERSTDGGSTWTVLKDNATWNGSGTVDDTGYVLLIGDDVTHVRFLIGNDEASCTAAAGKVIVFEIDR